MKNGFKFIIIILALTGISCVTVTRQSLLYQEARHEARQGNIYFSFLKFSEYLMEFPDSPRAAGVKFAICEYYLKINDYQDAIFKLKEYIAEYPQDKSTVFAKALLYQAMSRHGDSEAAMEEIKEGLFSKSLLLVFSQSKSKSYTTILNDRYKLVDYIDRIEFYKNNELFLAIRP